MNKWALAIVGLIFAAFATKYIVDLRKENGAIAQKLIDEHARMALLKSKVAEDERKLDMSSLEEKRRLENLKQLIVAKQKELQTITERISALKQNPDAAKAKLNAEADLKAQKDRVDTIQNQIKPLEQTKNNLKTETHDDQQMIEGRFRNQDTNLNYQLKNAQDTLRALEDELRAIRVIRKDPVAINEKNSKAQEVVNQKAYISDLQRQKRDLNTQHAIQKNNVNTSLSADQSQIDQQILNLKTQLKDESARYDVLNKNLKSFSNSEEGIRNQLKTLEAQRQSLQQEISDLQATH